MFLYKVTTTKHDMTYISSDMKRKTGEDAEISMLLDVGCIIMSAWL